MKSLLITLEYPPDVGGVATYYYSEAKQNSSIEVLHFAYKQKRLSWIQCIFPFIKKVRAGTYKEVRVGQTLPLGYLGLLGKFFFRKPYSVYVHGMDVLQKSSLWKRFWMGVILRHSHGVIANSFFVKERVQKKYKLDEEKCTVVHPHIDVPGIERKASNVPKVAKPARFVLLSVGRLVSRKGFDKVIETVAQLKGETHYWIIGDGPDKGRLEKLVDERGLQNYVSFLGAIPVPRIYGYYRACDVFIMPAREVDGDVEGFGIVFLEAGVFGKPVIGGQSGGVVEAVEDGVTGLLVEPEDVDGIAHAIKELLGNEALARRLGEQGYARVREKFAWGKIRRDPLKE